MKKILFDFLKVYNELGKDKKFETSRPFFQEKLPSEKVRANVPLALLKLKPDVECLLWFQRNICVLHMHMASQTSL